MRLFPDFNTRDWSAIDIARRWDADGCARLVVVGPDLLAVRAMLEQRTMATG